MRTFLLLALSLPVFGACQAPKEDPLVQKGMEELTFFREVATETPNAAGDRCKCASTYYYIIGSKIPASDIDSAVARFVRENIDSLKGKAEQLIMTFYTRSTITNKEHLSLNPRDIDRYSQDHDMVWAYSWHKGNNATFRFKFKNGEIIDPKDEIKVTDIP